MNSETTMLQKWLSVIGIGEDGVPGLSLVARSLLNSANTQFAQMGKLLQNYLQQTLSRETLLL
jgi:precorrin-6B methylase 1